MQKTFKIGSVKKTVVMKEGKDRTEKFVTQGESRDGSRITIVSDTDDYTIRDSLRVTEDKTQTKLEKP